MKKRDRIKRAKLAGQASKGKPRGESSRENGKRGGRPENPDTEVKRIMRERGVSRQRAHQILRGPAKEGA